MKKLLLYILLSAFTVSYSFAQKDVIAKKILAQVSAKYRTYDIVKADFSFTIDDPQANVRDVQSGTLIVRSKANKYKVTINSPGDKNSVAEEIISDGKSQWTYQKKDKEVQLSNVDNTGDNINPAQLFTIYEKGYKYVYTGDVKLDGKTCQVIDLTPDDEKKQFFKVRLSIDKIKKQIVSAVIFDKNGSRYTYYIKSFTPNAQLPETIFTFDKKDHPGVEVVDLR